MTFLIKNRIRVILISYTLLTGQGVDAESLESKPVDFAREILPILSDKCFVCHGPDNEDEGTLKLDSYESATRDLGGYQAINPEQLSASELITRVHSTEDPMPPADAEKQLTEAEKQLLERWVLQGGQYATHWAFVPPKKHIPSGAESRPDEQLIDAFIEQELNQQQLSFAPPAEPAILARRAALILTGLPPEPEFLQEFLNDQSPAAYERLVDRLLASPRFGEHQARYWLDAVRYGDTHGLHLDNRRGIYPYRDWVVSAFNKNLPFDQFITWQLAGDLLPNPTLEQLVATGYVRMNPTTAEGGAIPQEFQAKNNFDRVENLGTIFLGMSLNCARCHTHNYDPITQTEYYRLMAFFNSTAEHSMDGNKYDYAPVVQAPKNLLAWQEWEKLVERRATFLKEAERKLLAPGFIDEATARRWKEAGHAERLEMLADPNGPFTRYPIHIHAVIFQQQMQKPQETFVPTLVAQELKQPRVTRLLERGEYDQPTGDPLQPGVITVMGSLPESVPANRLGLAHWLTSPDHPLVSRVLINRVWQRVFGEGLVRTPEDFGLQGQQPTHPELLDWLAVEFQESGWNLKRMLKLMVTSQTFQQSSRWREGINDPENRLYARGPGYRLDAEVIRDIGLWSSGLLVNEQGGEGIKPYQPPGLWSALMHPASNTKHYQQDQGTRLYRRSLYVYWKRTCPHPMMTLFDAPSRESSCVRRSRTNTPLQSLGLFNESQRMEMARVLAQRLLLTHQDDQQRLDSLFLLLTCTKPETQQRAACEQLLQQMKSRYQAAPEDAEKLLSIGQAPPPQERNLIELAAWTQLASTVLASDLSIMLY